MMRKKFVACGVLGWCMEIVFTGLGSLRKNEHSLTARTSIWMFPIYGMACFLTAAVPPSPETEFFWSGAWCIPAAFLPENFSPAVC